MFSLLLVLFVVVGLSLSLFLTILLLLQPKKCKHFVSGDTTILIVKIVESHRQSLPLNSAHGWNLVPSNCRLRCWKKELTCNILGSPITVYGCSKIVNCSAVIVLNVIADISTWPEWDVEAQEQRVHLELPEDVTLHNDPYMQCDQLVLTTPKTKEIPEVVMYRFGNLESNGTGWILLWDAKQLDWMLYIVQPLNEIGDTHKSNKCTMTAIWGHEFDPSFDIHRVSEQLCSKVLNLSDAILFSQLKLRPFQPMIETSSLYDPHLPTIHTALNDLPEKPCVLLVCNKKPPPAAFKNHALAVVPTCSQNPLSVKDICGFSLALRPMKSINAMNGDSVALDDKHRSRRRYKIRSDSMTSSYPRLKQLELENRRSSSLSTPIRKKPPELTVTKAEEEPKSPHRATSHSFLDIIFQRRRSSAASGKNSRSPSPSRHSSPTHRNRSMFEKTSSVSSQEDISHDSMYCDTYVSNAASDTDDESFKIFQEFQNGNSDLKTIGEYSVSVVLKECQRASAIDISPSDEVKKISDGWMFKEMNKDIVILKKTTAFGSCVVMSHLCKGVIPSSHQIVWKTLCNPLTRYMYDDTVKKITVIKEYAEGQKLIHMYNESVTILHKEMEDFCILQTERKMDNHCVVGLISVKDNLCPSMADVTRGNVMPSGWIIKSVPEKNECEVSYLVQMVIKSPEINLTEEISNIQAQCINNLSLYLSTKPPSILVLPTEM